MGLFERPKASGVWHISYCDRAGKRHREKIGRRSEALEAYTTRKREIREGRFLPPRSSGRSVSFRELARQMMEHNKLRLARRSYEGDLGKLEQLIPMLGSMEAAAIGAPEIQQVLDKLRARLNEASTNRYRSLLSSIFGYGLRMGLIRSNPVGQVKRFKEKPGRVRWLKDEEEKRLREAIRTKYPEREPEFDLALYTGMRRGEQFTLKWENVDLKNGSLTVNGKSGRRNVKVNSSAAAALGNLGSFYLGNQTPYVCPETSSDTQRDWRRWFEDCITIARIPNFRWHDLRHTFASRLVMAGVPLLTVGALLGHKSYKMTERYAHLSQPHLTEAVEKIGSKQ